MPVERRDILFYLNEVKDMIENDADLFDNRVPKNIDELNLSMVLHSGSMDGLTREERHGYLNAMQIANIQESCLIFVADKKGLLGKKKSEEFFLPDSMMVECFVRECSRRDIIMPRESRKTIIVDNMMVGMRIDKTTSSLEFDES